MCVYNKRTYQSENRCANAAKTRERILKSAKKIFQTEGVSLATIEKIAQKAEVSVPTVYAIFKSKCGILRALLDETFTHQDWNCFSEELEKEKCAKKSLKLIAKFCRQAYDIEKQQMDFLRGVTMLSPEFKEIEMEREGNRYIEQKSIVHRLWSERFIVKGLRLKKAKDLLWAYTGREIYRMFVIEKAWTSDEYEKWLSKTLIETLLDS